MESLFSILFPIVFVAIFICFIVMFIRVIISSYKNYKAPQLTVRAKIVAKRANTSSSGFDDMPNSTHTSYYATFEFESGDRMELHVNYRDFGLLAEGDYGRLTFKGTKFISFERHRNIPSI